MIEIDSWAPADTSLDTFTSVSQQIIYFNSPVYSGLINADIYIIIKT